jgi:hypothetical protein
LRFFLTGAELLRCFSAALFCLLLPKVRLFFSPFFLGGFFFFVFITFFKNDNISSGFLFSVRAALGRFFRFSATGGLNQSKSHKIRYGLTTIPAGPTAAGRTAGPADQGGDCTQSSRVICTG